MLERPPASPRLPAAGVAVDRRSSPLLSGALVLLVLCGIATRLPLLASPVLEADGDEAIVGIMAERLLAGGRIPIYFLGQSYGFALVEVLLAAASFALFGVSAAAMKGAMLLLWLIGAGFLVAAARRLEGDRAALLAAILFVACPAWGAWSLKARGGYLTAFACANAALWMTLGGATSVPRRELLRDAAIGILSGLCLVSKPLWILPLAPYVLQRSLRQEKPFRSMLAVALPALLVALSIHSIGRGQATGDYFPSLVNVGLWEGSVALPMLVWHTLGGAFEMRQAVGAPAFAIAACVWSIGGLAVVAIGIAIFRSSHRLARRHLSWLGIGVLLLAEIPSNVPRYLLPAIDHAVLWMAAELTAWVRAGRARWSSAVVFALVLALAGTVGIVALSRVSYSPSIGLDARVEHEAMEELVATLDARGCRYVYATRPYLPWCLMFRTHERILARSTAAEDRDPPSHTGVDRAQEVGLPTALVALVKERPRIESLLATDARIVDVGSRYLLVERPTDELLVGLGFARAEEP